MLIVVSSLGIYLNFKNKAYELSLMHNFGKFATKLHIYYLFVSLIDEESNNHINKG